MPVEAIVLDSNLLILMAVGNTSRRYIGKHKRVRAYSESDFDLLLGLIAPFPKIIVTPNTLTEASNLVGQVGEPVRSQIFQTLRAMIAATDELYVPSSQAAERDEFCRLGLTDSVLLEVLSGSCTLLTADLDLYLTASRRGFKVMNFNHLRMV